MLKLSVQALFTNSIFVWGTAHRLNHVWKNHRPGCSSFWKRICMIGNLSPGVRAASKPWNSFWKHSRPSGWMKLPLFRRNSWLKTARLHASAKPPAIMYCMGITQHTPGTDNVKSLANLAMLCCRVIWGKLEGLTRCGARTMFRGSVTWAVCRMFTRDTRKSMMPMFTAYFKLHGVFRDCRAHQGGPAPKWFGCNCFHPKTKIYIWYNIKYI